MPRLRGIFGFSYGKKADLLSDTENQNFLPRIGVVEQIPAIDFTGKGKVFLRHQTGKIGIQGIIEEQADFPGICVVGFQDSPQHRAQNLFGKRIEEVKAVRAVWTVVFRSPADKGYAGAFPYIR